MRRTFCRIGLALLLAAMSGLGQCPVIAQVISGESIYEDNFAHTPPQPAPERRDAGASTDLNPAKPAARELSTRDRP